MSFRSIVRELREMKDGIGSLSRRRSEGKHWRSRTLSHIAPDVAPSEPVEQGKWANLPPELLLDIIHRLEDSETSWPARTVVVSCASVCKSWRGITKEIVKTVEQCGRLTFPISLKQPGPRDFPIQCFIKRDRATSTYCLYFGLTPSENENDKLLLAAKRIRRPTSTSFIISLVADNFSRSSNTYIGKLRSNFLGTKFTTYDSQPPTDTTVDQNSSSSRGFHTKQLLSRLPRSGSYSISQVFYELNPLRTRGPRKMQCVMNYIPVSSIQEGGTAPTPISSSSSPSLKKSPNHFKSSPLFGPVDSTEPLILTNKSPRWHEQLQCWCLNFKGRVTVASVKNFQLVAAVDPLHEVSVDPLQEKVILQFGKIGKDIFTMDYQYPLSAFQAFALCLSSFDTKPVYE
ncbi:tubby-like F-box protein 5 [Impatiens glandulifera]|uniref:tubby-like F-box protein 5 n=1 Tax=Impatiens glandulifera TaxID=253017 RepID=UPI001FB089F3|nr:tubby-like F-box protein 5 [Impatiens glandulifera]XP_047322654.1 tubby-like F-box protein 5 [Impatiens glandulifera]